MSFCSLDIGLVTWLLFRKEPFNRYVKLAECCRETIEAESAWAAEFALSELRSIEQAMELPTVLVRK